MNCLKKDCDKEAVTESNYCKKHQPTTEKEADEKTNFFESLLKITSLAVQNREKSLEDQEKEKRRSERQFEIRRNEIIERIKIKKEKPYRPIIKSE